MAFQSNIYKTASFDSITGVRTIGRDHLATTESMESMNTYKNFGVFPTNQGGEPVWKKDKNNEDFTEEEIAAGKTAGSNTNGAPGVRSLFNRSAALLVGNAREVDRATYDTAEGQAKVWRETVRESSEYRLSSNVPLMDTPEVRKKLRDKAACTTRDLVLASKKGVFGRSPYSYADFMYCKHLGRVPNNYLVTLRRYPIPVTDSMMPAGGASRRSRKARKTNNTADTAVPIGTMVTWIGVSGNEMSQILKYTVAMPFEEKQAQWEDINKMGGDNGILNSMEAAMNPTIRNQFNAGYNGHPAAANASASLAGGANAVLGKIPGVGGRMGGMFKSAGGEYAFPGSFRDSQKIYGPIDRVKSNYKRGENGITMDQKFSLVFEYELRAYNGINPKQAMLDLLATILATCYTNGGFWKGGYNPIAAGQSSAFRNLNIFKAHGSFTDYMEAFTKDVRHGADAVTKKINENGGVLESIKQVLNIMGGMLIGGLLNSLGRPARYQANSLLSESPVGLWHVTIGNPLRPIMSMGNMILKGTTIEHSGPLGLDDFPTQLKVTCEFDRGKPRDAWGVEQMYMRGDNRIYQSMSKYTHDMYKRAEVYKKGGSGVSYASKVRDSLPSIPKTNKLSSLAPSVIDNINDLSTSLLPQKKEMNTVELTEVIVKPSQSDTFLQDFFGDVDRKAIIMSAREQEEGAFKPTAGENEQTKKRDQEFENLKRTGTRDGKPPKSKQ